MKNPKFLLFILCTALLSISFNAQARHPKNIKEKTEQRCDRPIRVYDYDDTDVPPHFPGGECGLMKYINTERCYPIEAYRSGVCGRVLCSFIVHADGTITHIAVLRGVEETLNREAVRLISEMPLWQPGIVNGEPVAVLCYLPISFRR